mgnify:CR=1 FL=1
MIKQRMHRRLSWAVWLCCCLLFSACGDDKPAGSAPGDTNNAPQCGGDCPPTELSLNLDDSQQEVVVSGQVELVAQATDDKGLSKMALFVDDTLLVESDASPLNHTWDTDALEEGAHTLRLVATDTADQSEALEVAVTIDRNAPVVSLLAPEEGAVVGDTLVFRAEAQDTVGVRSVRFGILGATVSATAQAEPWEATLDLSELESGPYTVLATATDGAELTDQDARSVILDRPPVVSFEGLTAGDVIRSRTLLRLDATDDGTIESTAIYVDGALLSEDTEVQWTPEATQQSAVLRAVALDDRGQEGSVEITVTVDIDPCDRDGDGAQAPSEECGGDDCADDDPETFPGAPDEVGDEQDQNCDGADGVDADGDTFASAMSGGRDCDDDDPVIFPCPFDPPGLCTDRVNDRRHCGACNDACDVGLACVDSACTCTDPDCVEGEPEAYDFDVPATFITGMEVVTSPTIGRDLDNDGRPDNSFGPLMGSLAQLLGGNINTELRNQILLGALALGTTWPNLPEGDFSGAQDVSVDFISLVDTDDDPATRQQYLADRASFLPGYVTPRSRFRGGVMEASQLEVGPADQFSLVLPVADARLAMLIEDVYLEGTVRRDSQGIALFNASLAGVLTAQSFVDTVNEYLTSESCTCLGLEGPLIDLRLGTSNEACVGEFTTRDCNDQEGICTAIAGTCGIFMSLLSGSLDLDTDEDGQPDAFSVYLRLSGQGTQITGLAP